MQTTRANCTTNLDICSQSRLMGIVLFWLFGTVLSAQPLLADEQRWYQIEMIVFANLGGRWQDSEQWRDEFSLSYPSNLSILRPFKTFEFEEIDTDFDHLRKEYKPAPLNTPRESGESGLYEASASPPREFSEPLVNPITSDTSSNEGVELEGDIEFSGFPTMSTLPAGISTLSEQSEHASTATRDAEPIDLGTDPFILLPETELQLRDVSRRMHNAFDMRVISHLAWRQPVAERAHTVPVLIQGGDQYGLDFELEGLARLSESRFIHIDIDLFLSRFQRLLINSTENWTELGTKHNMVVHRSPNDWAFDAAPGQQQPLFGHTADQFERVFTAHSKSTRRIRTGELHYIDHPLLGVLVQVTPYSLPDPVMDMRDFDLEALPKQKPLPVFGAIEP